MGKKITWEDAEKLGIRKSDNESVFAPENKYGYKININHPKIRPYYELYKRKIGAIILSDKERFDFEAKIFQLLNRLKKEKRENE